MSMFTYQIKKTPSGRYYVQVFVGSVCVATGRKTHETGEVAMTEITTAYENGTMMQVANVTRRFMEIMEERRLVEKLKS